MKSSQIFKISFLVLVLFGVSAQAWFQQNEIFSTLEKQVPSNSFSKQHLPSKEVKRQRFVTFNSEALMKHIQASESVWLPLFEDIGFEVLTQKFQKGEDGLNFWQGEIEADIFGRASLFFRDGSIDGTIQVDNQVFTIERNDKGALVIAEVVATPNEFCHEPDEDQDIVLRKSAPTKPYKALKSGTDDHHVKVLVLFDPKYCHKTDNFRAQYETALNETFGADYLGLYDRIHFEVTTECYSGFSQKDSFNDERDNLGWELDNLQADPHVENLRYAHQADLVVLLTDTYGTYAGIAKTVDDNSTPNLETTGFHSVVSKEYALSYHTLAHEIGHNFDMMHDRKTRDLANSSKCDFGVGYHNEFVTTMTYAWEYGNATRVPVFSQPYALYGFPCGSGNLAADNRLEADVHAHTRESYFAADYLVTQLPFTTVNTTYSHGDTFNVDGNDGRDVAYLLKLPQNDVVTITTNVNAVYPLTIQVFDAQGNSVAVGNSPLTLSLDTNPYYVVVDDRTPFRFPFTLVIQAASSEPWKMPINSIGIQLKNSSGVTFDPDWAWDNTDLNENAGGPYLYMGWTRSDVNPITDLTIINIANSSHVDSIVNIYENWGWEVHPIDLNKGAGGNWIYIAVRRDGNSPITDITIDANNSSSQPNKSGWLKTNVDLNENAGGKYIWLYYKK